jgi:membrane-associated phospholipid phosphatase
MHRVIRPETQLLALFLVVLIAVNVAFGGRLTVDKLTAKTPMVAVVLLSVAAAADAIRRRARNLRLSGTASAVARILADWLPAILCIVVYENLHDVARLVHSDTYDARLARIDLWMFGTQPTIWLQRLVSPWFTDVMAFAYGSYFFTPTILATLLYVRRQTADFRLFMLLVITAMYAGFVGYLLVPAIGPLYYLRDAYTNPVVLKGIWLHQATAAVMNEYRAINTDCFPSLHTAASTITLVWAWRVRDRIWCGRALAWVYLVLMVALWFSTVYLRYHWVIDVLAGWALAAAILVFVPRWSAWHQRRLEVSGR